MTTPNTRETSAGGTADQTPEGSVPLVRAGSTRPATLPVIAANIPAELTALDQWVCWRWETRDGKPTKPPYQPNGQPAKSTDPATWSTFNTVLDAYQAGRFDGIGFAVTDQDNFCGIDLDHCVDDGQIAEWAQNVVDRVDSYTEISPSGQGIRIVLAGQLPPGRRKTGNVEMYDSGRYLTITGRTINPANIEDRQTELEAFHTATFPPKTENPAPAGPTSLSDADILDLARNAANSAKFTACYNGNNDHTADGTASAGDLSLVSILAFYTRDPAQLDRLFRGSGRMRDKWNRADYRQRTIDQALELVTETYEPVPDWRIILTPESNTGEAPPTPDAFLDWSTFWQKDRTDAEWLIPDFLARGRGHALYAPAGTKKSLFTLTKAAEAATGPDPIVVVYLDYEMSEDDLYERLEDMGYGPDTDLTRLYYALLPSLPPLDTPEGGKALNTLLDYVTSRHPYHQVLVVIDTTGRAVEGEENSADTFRRFYSATGIILKRRGTTWVRLDHTGKDIAKGQRGSKGKDDDPDIVWLLRETDNGVMLTGKKRRMGWVPERATFLQTSSPLRFTRVGGDWPKGTEETAGILDRLEVPLNATTREAQTALQEAGEGRQRATVVQAQKYRNHYGNHYQLTVPEPLSKPLGTTPEKPSNEGPEPQREPLGTTLLRGTGTGSPVLQGTVHPPPSESCSSCGIGDGRHAATCRHREPTPEEITR